MRERDRERGGGGGGLIKVARKSKSSCRLVEEGDVNFC